ncbi:Zinc finger BED domain-containing protein RICESLEEPER 2 [Glycine max]|nr:Zinc finger BED domain-containing protein RICESLEEPER 2 [Glycine max]
MHEYPFSIVGHVGFKRYLAALQLVFQVPCRNIIKRETYMIYQEDRPTTLKLLDSLHGRVAITSDMWAASNKKRGSFMFSLLTQVKNFCNVLVECLMDWNIDTKLSILTLDNCSTNDKMIDKIKDKLHLGSLLRDEILLHMRCCAHILNLIVKYGLEVVKDGIEKIRDSVAFWTTTPKRKEKFEETTKQLRIPCTKSETQLIKIIEIAISYEVVFTWLKQRESHYTSLSSSLQWQFAKDVRGRLKVFNIDVIHNIIGVATILDPWYKRSFFNIIMINCMNMTLLIKLGRLDCSVMTWFLIIK